MAVRSKIIQYEFERVCKEHQEYVKNLEIYSKKLDKCKRDLNSFVKSKYCLELYITFMYI